MERATQFTEPIVTNFLQLLKNLNKVTKELGDSAPEKAWNSFVTSNNYVNFRMITFEKGYFAPKYIPKELSLLRAREDCMRSCAKNESCLAFNLYDTQNNFVCEMLPDNLCVNRTKIAFAEWPGSTVWEKMSSGVQQSCVDAKFPVGRHIPCEALRPGCFGEWPQCSNCLRTCKESLKLYNYGRREFTLWPEGDGHFVLPVFAHCFRDWLFLLRREVNLAEARLRHNYIMPFEDMHRFWRLKTYPYIQFVFMAASSYFWVDYENWYIDASGSLMNLTYIISAGPVRDIFDLNGEAMKPTPFIHVKEDRFGCGSFWLLDPNNATYCPGGRVSMLGEMRVEGGKVVSTGMSSPWPMVLNEIVHSVEIRLFGE